MGFWPGKQYMGQFGITGMQMRDGKQGKPSILSEDNLSARANVFPCKEKGRCQLWELSGHYNWPTDLINPLHISQRAFTPCALLAIGVQF